MLVRFSIENYSSFKNETSLNMDPVKSRTMKNHIISDGEGKFLEVLPIAVIYGANAGGKTNFVNALAFMQNLVLRGTRPDAVTGIVVHLLDPACEAKPSRFEIVFKYNKVIYTYGFLVTDKEIREEWLFAYFTTKESKLFERITKNNRVLVSAGEKLKKGRNKSEFIRFIAEGTRPNQLFLTELHSKNVEAIKPVINWFRDNLIIIRPQSKYLSLTMRAHKDRDFINYLSDFLNTVDTGINKITCEIEEFEPKKHLYEFPNELRNRINEDLTLKDTKNLLIKTPEKNINIYKDHKDGKAKYVRLRTEHIRTDGSAVQFDPSDESDGTRRLMDLAPMLFDMLERDSVYVVDELDRSLHTLLSRLFLQTCIESVSKLNARGQLILTTHDTNLLDRSLLRRDEIWFMEKDKEGASHLSCLAEYKVNEGLNYENGYLNGRFGAIPFFGDTSKLLK